MQDKIPCQSSKGAGFGGMKKGFMFSSSSKTASVSETSSTSTMPVDCGQKASDENIPFITPQKDFIESQHRFDEVQQAMQVNDAFAMNKGNLFINMDL